MEAVATVAVVVAADIVAEVVVAAGIAVRVLVPDTVEAADRVVVVAADTLIKDSELYLFFP